jgi:hypothetical protein
MNTFQKLSPRLQHVNQAAPAPLGDVAQPRSPGGDLQLNIQAADRLGQGTAAVALYGTLANILGLGTNLHSGYVGFLTAVAMLPY